MSNPIQYDDDIGVQLTFTRGELEQISSGLQDLNCHLLHVTYDEQKNDEDKQIILQTAMNNLKIKTKCDKAVLQHYPPLNHQPRNKVR